MLEILKIEDGAKGWLLTKKEQCVKKEKEVFTLMEPAVLCLSELSPSALFRYNLVPKPGRGEEAKSHQLGFNSEDHRYHRPNIKSKTSSQKNSGTLIFEDLVGRSTHPSLDLTD